jgi:hypothetical protein
MVKGGGWWARGGGDRARGCGAVWAVGDEGAARRRTDICATRGARGVGEGLVVLLCFDKLASMRRAGREAGGHPRAARRARLARRATLRSKTAARRYDVERAVRAVARLRSHAACARMADAPCAV